MNQKSISYFLIFIILDLSILNPLIFISINTKYNTIENLDPFSSNNDSWNRTWNWGSYVSSMGLDSSNNVILTLNSLSTFKIIKINGSGEELWNVDYGTWSYGYDYWYSTDLTIDSQDNIYIIGFQENWWSNIRHDFLLTKYSSLGNKDWEIIWYNEYETEGFSIATDSYNNIYVGIDKIDLDESFLVKYNITGSQTWNVSFVGSHISGLVIDSIDNIYLTRYLERHEEGDRQLFLLKYNNSGALLWNQTWRSGKSDYIMDLLIDSSDNIYITGYNLDCHDYCKWVEGRAYLLKVNSSGHLLWNKTLGDNSYWRMGMDSLENIYLTGYDEIYPGEREDMCLAKFNSSENIEWNIFWGGKGSERAYNIDLDSNDNIYLGGSLDNKPLLVKNPINKTVIEPLSNEFFIPFSFHFLSFTLLSIISIISVRVFKSRKKNFLFA
ncbi:MAG: hypothetical protein ACFFA3_08280 [Promethearchaeota archaeon]